MAICSHVCNHIVVTLYKLLVLQYGVEENSHSGAARNELCGYQQPSCSKMEGITLAWVFSYCLN
jgi:hypothetical protein